MHNSKNLTNDVREHKVAASITYVTSMKKAEENQKKSKEYQYQGGKKWYCQQSKK